MIPEIMNKKGEQVAKKKLTTLDLSLQFQDTAGHNN